MGLMIDRGGSSDEYEAVPLPLAGDLAGAAGAAVFLRRSARPSRRAVLHLHDLRGSFAPADLVRWYNERGFHFYVADCDAGEPAGGGGRRRQARSAEPCFAGLDAACRHLREADGIDAIIVSAQDAGAAAAALWCDARGTACPADALILSGPRFGRGRAHRLDITCPVLVISPRPDPGWGRAGRAAHRDQAAVRLGQHVTWLHLDADAAASGTTARRRLFDEMGRWLGAYMYGQVRDQLL